MPALCVLELGLGLYPGTGLLTGHRAAGRSGAAAAAWTEALAAFTGAPEVDEVRGLVAVYQGHEGALKAI